MFPDSSQAAFPKFTLAPSGLVEVIASPEGSSIGSKSVLPCSWSLQGCSHLILACLTCKERPNAAWQLHTYIPYSTGTSAGAAGNEILTYGSPQSLEQFCDQAQLANFVQYR